MSDTNLFKLNDKGYFKCSNVDVMAFDDFYPAGHQSGITLIMNDKRLLANGDVRFEQTPGQWQPLPKQLCRNVDEEENTITTMLKYPDENQHLKGFNPLFYPDFQFEYEVVAKGYEDGVEVVVNLSKPVPEEFYGKLSFNMELFPGEMFGRSWIVDKKTGIFSRQPNGPTLKKKSLYENDDNIVKMEPITSKVNGYNPATADDIIAAPLAEGRAVTIVPENPEMSFTVESSVGSLGLYDGRMNHNNGWFVISCNIPMNVTKGAVKLFIRPNVDSSWIKPATIQVSQIGFHPAELKKAIIELDSRDKDIKPVILKRLTASGAEIIEKKEASEWGKFLRYNYLTYDFTDIKENGLYVIEYGDVKSNVFRIAEDVYERGVWQPVLEYFLPVQMCHMRVNEKYRVWHGLCHMDDGRMAPTDYNHFDGAIQGSSTLTKYKPGEHICGLNCGGWHDAGDFDLRIESQTTEVYHLSLAIEEFDAYIDETTVDQVNHVTEIHCPDGKNDILEQIEHGLLSITGGYKSMGRLYKQIICKNLRQYVLLGDAVNMTPGTPDNEDERLVFTEDNPVKELTAAAHIACASRTMKGFNDELSKECFDIARELYDVTDDHEGRFVTLDYQLGEHKPNRTLEARIHAAAELLITTKEEKYKEFIVSNLEYIKKSIFSVGWIVCRVIEFMPDDFVEEFKTALKEHAEKTEELSAETPYGIPYRPAIWGAGWSIQGMGSRFYFFYKAFPEIFKPDLMYNALQFILGCHPGSNTESFASGVGVKSSIIAYGANRADWSYIPGGVVSGTALIRPDLPELLDFPYLWQQKEYVIGGGSTNYLLLVLAVKYILENVGKQ